MIKLLLLILLFLVSLTLVRGQTKNFQLNNPGAIELNTQNLEILTSNFWRVFKEEVENRGTTFTKPKYVALSYETDGTFYYNGITGTWKILDGKYIDHILKEEDKAKLNFGGLFSITEISSSRIVLTKLLTSSHDMKRTMYLMPSETLIVSQRPYYYDGILDSLTIDSISNMNYEQLFSAGLNVNYLKNEVTIITPDSTYFIILKTEN